jgi:hypothetical protein
VEELELVLAEVFGSKVRNDGTWLYTLVSSDGGYFNARIRNNPVAEMFVALRPLDGFELTLKGERMRPDATFDNALTVSTNDHELARLWLDDLARKTLMDSAYEYASTESYLEGLGADVSYRPPGLSTRRIWTYEIANDEMIASKGTVEPQGDRIAIALEAACTMAGRTRRWAAEYAPIASRVGAKLHSEVELGGAPVLVSNRASVDVSLQLLRRLPGERNGRLRTLVTAKRVGLHDERSFSLVNRSARSTMVPPLPDGSRKDFGIEDYRMRATAEVALDEMAHKQLLAARPAAVIADLDSIDVWFDGAPLDADQLDAAFALAAHLAIGNAAQHGPYR